MHREDSTVPGKEERRRKRVAVHALGDFFGQLSRLAGQENRVRDVVMRDEGAQARRVF
jgi:hypothetical protein